MSKKLTNEEKFNNYLEEVVRSIPMFLFLSEKEEETINDILLTDEATLFEKVSERYISNGKPCTIGLLKKFINNKYLKEDSVDIYIDKINEFEAQRNHRKIFRLISRENDLLKLHTGSKQSAHITTPIHLVEDMVNKVSNDKLNVFMDKESKFIDLACGYGNFLLFIKEVLMYTLEEEILDKEERERHIVENMLYGVETDELNRKMASKLLSFNKFKTNILKENPMGMKFDVTIANPPYKGDLHLKFLEKANELTNEEGSICFVHPGAWILDEKPKKNVNKVHKSCLNIISEYKTDLEFINGNKEFNAKFFVPCVITHIDKAQRNSGIKVKNRITNSKDRYSSVKEVNIRGNKKEYFSLKRKLLESPTTLVDKLNKDEGEFCVEMSLIRGNVDKETMTKDDFYTFVPRDYKVRLLKDCDKRIRFSFKKEEEGNNFLNYLKTDFARFALSIYKINGHLDSGELAIIPYLDFSQTWDDKKLIKHFNLSKDEVQLIKESIVPYYGDKNV